MAKIGLGLINLEQKSKLKFIIEDKEDIYQYFTRSRSVLGHACHQGPRVGQGVELLDGVKARNSVKASADKKVVADGNSSDRTVKKNDKYGF